MTGRLASLTAALAAAMTILAASAGTAWAAGSATTAATTAATSAASATTTSVTTATAPAPAVTGTTAAAPAPKTTPTTTPAPTPAPAPAVKAAAKLVLPDAFFVHTDALALAGRAVHVQGTVRPYVPGQWVQVVSSLNKKVFKTDKLRIKPSANKAYGVFTETLRSPHAGIVRVEVSHKRTTQMSAFEARRALAAFTAPGPGARGPSVLLIQHDLVALHFYLPVSGVYDQQTELAVDAYHRLLGRGVAQTLDPATLGDLFAGRGSFHVRFPKEGKHVEGDLGNQVLALINGSKVYAIYPISSGKPSTPTILGHFYVYERQPGYLPDGMYYSDFFHGGYAIHGYDPAPDYPASHGCMRLPISDAISVWNWLTIGVPVDVYQ